MDENKRIYDDEQYKTDVQNNGTDVYYNALQNESYKALLNSEVQAANARDQALKYTQNALKQSGYANQGLSESSRMGIYNTYQNALLQANQQRIDNETKINDENFKTFTALMGNEVDTNGLNALMGENNIGINEDGTLDYSNSRFANDLASQQQINTLYRQQMSSFGDTNQQQAFSTTNDKFVAYDKNGQNPSMVSKDRFKKQISALEAAVINGTLPKNTAIKLQSGKGYKIYILVGENGNVNYITRDEYHNHTNGKFIIDKNGKLLKD